MIFRERPRQRWSADKTFRGRKNGYVIDVNWSDYHKYWYFTANKDDGSRYNSLWEKLNYEGRAECEIAAEQWACVPHRQKK